MKSKTSQAMWGGRFSSAPSDLIKAINASIDFDKRLCFHDLQGSVAHCKMLIDSNIIPQEDGNKILDGLQQIKHEFEEGSFIFRTEFEDIHMNIEARLKEIIGDCAGRLHTARSRNDQVATSFRLWLKDAILILDNKLDLYIKALKNLAKKHQTTIMPGFTHLQIAQPIAFAWHIEAYIEMAKRDKTRLKDCFNRLNECPLGACALSGTSYPINRKQTAQMLGFEKPMINTLDAVSARDFALEFLANATILGLNLSRLAEEMILFSSSGFNFIELSDTLTTGSSIMPQKKNPDGAELIRAKTGKLTGNFISLAMVMKALPLAYNKDMQEDKTPVFESFDILCLSLDVMAEMIKTLKVNKENMRDMAEKGYSTATELADWLVKTLNLPFRKAHHITGAIVKLAEKQKKQLQELSLNELQKIEPLIHKGIYDALNVDSAVNARKNNPAKST